MSYVWRLFFPCVTWLGCSCACALSDFVPSLKTSHANWTGKLQGAEQGKALVVKKKKKMQGIAPRTAWLRPATWFSRQHISFLFILRADSVSLAGYWNLPRSSRTSAVSQAEPELEFVFDFIKNGFKYFSKRNFFPPCILFLYLF